MPGLMVSSHAGTHGELACRTHGELGTHYCVHGELSKLELQIHDELGTHYRVHG